jgi:hypothetical protein
LIPYSAAAIRLRELFTANAENPLRVVLKSTLVLTSSNRVCSFVRIARDRDQSQTGRQSYPQGKEDSCLV